MNMRQSGTAVLETQVGRLTPEPAPEPKPPAFNMLAHISMRGDVQGRSGEWLGQLGSGLAIEGLLLMPTPETEPHGVFLVECQLVYSKDIKTPWTSAGVPCGSAGLGLGCRGVRFRMTTEAAPFFECRYDIAFTDGTKQADVPGNEIACSTSGAEVEAIRLQIIPRVMGSLGALDDLNEGLPCDGDVSPQTDSTIRLRLLSPSFVTRQPNIRNASTIPESQWRAMAVSLERPVFGARIVSVRRVDEAIVAGEGLVFDRASNLVPGTNRLMSDDNVERFWMQAKEARSRSIRRISGLSLLCKTRAPDNFGHFLVEMFPKAWLGKQLFPTMSITNIIHNTSILEVAFDALVGIGVNPYAISITDSQPVVCESLIVIDGLTSHGTYQSPITAQALSDLADAIPPGPHRKIYVRRDAQRRALLNQDAVETVIRGRGFAVVDPGKMRLKEQIAVFKGATTVVGPLGAALTNIVFCPPGSKVVALTSQSFPDTFFWFISQHRKLDYQEVRGLDASRAPDEPRSWIGGFSISDEDLTFLAEL